MSDSASNSIQGASEMRSIDLKAFPYAATSLSIIGRFIFMFLIYRNKSSNTLSLTFCFLSIVSSSMWLFYSVSLEDTPMVFRSSTELFLLSISSVYIIHNKVVNYRLNRVVPSVLEERFEAAQERLGLAQEQKITV